MWVVFLLLSEGYSGMSREMRWEKFNRPSKIHSIQIEITWSWKGKNPIPLSLLSFSLFLSPVHIDMRIKWWSRKQVIPTSEYNHLVFSFPPFFNSRFQFLICAMHFHQISCYFPVVGWTLRTIFQIHLFRRWDASLINFWGIKWLL